MKRIIFAGAMIFFSGSFSVCSYEIGDIEIHGFASTGYMISDNNNFLLNSEDGSFEFTEAAINISSSLTDRMRVGVQLYSFDLGDIGNHKFELDWAFLDYQFRESFGARVGKMKTPHGLYNEIHDYDMLHTPIILPQGVYIWYAREMINSSQGLSLYGTLSAGSLGRFSYDTIVGTSSLDSDGGVSKFSSTRGLDFRDGKIHHIYGGRIKWNSPVKGLIFAVSGLEMDLDFEFDRKDNPNIKVEASSSDFRILLYSTEYNLGKLSLVGEYWRLTGEMLTKTRNIPNYPAQREDLNLEGWYSQISYRLTNRLETGMYYGETYMDKNDRKGERQKSLGMPDYRAWQKDLAITTRFDITDFWLLKLEVHFIDGVALCAEVDNPDGFEDQKWTLFAVKTTFSF